MPERSRIPQAAISGYAGVSWDKPTIISIGSATLPFRFSNHAAGSPPPFHNPGWQCSGSSGGGRAGHPQFSPYLSGSGSLLVFPVQNRHEPIGKGMASVLRINKAVVKNQNSPSRGDFGDSASYGTVEVPASFTKTRKQFGGG